MNAWLFFVDIVRFALFATAHVLGGSIGSGVLVFALVIRVALLPLTLPVARRARRHQASLRRIKPDLDALRQRFKADPQGLRDATLALYRKHGIQMQPDLRAALVQWPIAAAIYKGLSGIERNTRFLWIRDLTRPDVGLAVVAAGIAAFAAKVSGTDNPRVAMIIGGALTFFVAWRMSASVALYSIAWSGVSAGESLVLAIAERRTSKSR